MTDYKTCTHNIQQTVLKGLDVYTVLKRQFSAPKSVVGVSHTGSSILVLKLSFSPDPFPRNLPLSL